MLFNILLYVVMIYMIFRMFSMNKGVNRRRKIIYVVNQIQDEAAFYEAADELISSEEDEVIRNKTRIIRLWGTVYHKNLDHFEEDLNEIDLEPLFIDKKGVVTIETDEDSFFYLLLTMPNMLYGLGRNDLRSKVFEKVSQYEDRLNNKLIMAIAEHCNLFYDGKDDLGEEFFRNIDQGEYPGYMYSKQLIGIYKNICDTMLCRILSDRNEDYSEFEIYAESFAKTGVGKRWIEVLGLNIKAPDTDENSDYETFDETEDVPQEIEEAPVSEEEFSEEETSETEETDKEEAE